MVDDEWMIQKKLKYRDHELPPEDIPDSDFELIRSGAVKDFIETGESDNVKLIVSSFTSYLT